MIVRRWLEVDEQNLSVLLGTGNLGIKIRWFFHEGVDNKSQVIPFSLGHLVIEPEKSYLMHNRNRSEAIFIIEGKVVIETNGRELAMEAGDVIFSHPGELISLKNSGVEPVKTIYCCSNVR